MFWLAVASVLSYGVAAPNYLGSQRILRIVGGKVTTIDRYPFLAALLYGNVTFRQSCGGSIVNTRSILSAAHCFWFDQNPQHHRIRVGSNFPNSGGAVHNISQIILHPNYQFFTLLQGCDLVIIRSSTTFNFNNLVQPAILAGHTYYIEEKETVWAIGWGVTAWPGTGIPPEDQQLHHVQLRAINHDICRRRYGVALTDDMLCSGILDVGGKGQCFQDSGGPLVHQFGNTLVVVGVSSWGSGCGDPYFPGINTRVSSFNKWIRANL